MAAWSTTFTGTPPDAVTAAAIGADSKNGTGTALYQAPGADGLTTCCRFTTVYATSGKSYFTTDVTGQTLIEYRGTFKAAAAPSGDAGVIAPLVQITAAAGVIQARWYFKASGALVMRSTGTTTVYTSDHVFTDGLWYQWIYQYDTVTDTQIAWVWRDGYFEEMTGATGAAAPISSLYGVCDTSTFVLDMDDGALAFTASPEPDPFGLFHAIPGNPTPSGFDIAVYTEGIDTTRAIILDAAGTTELATTSESDVAAHNRSQVFAAGLAPGTEYTYQIEGLTDDGWAPYGATGKAFTAPARGYPVPEILVVGDGCQLDNLPDLQTWDDQETAITAARAAGALIFGINGGDFDYSNVMSVEPGDHRFHWARQLRNTPAMKEAYANRSMITYRRSDHCGGGNNATFSDPAQSANIFAFKDSFPAWELWDLGSDPVAHTGHSVAIGRWLFVCPDFRTEAREDWTIVGTDALAYSSAQEDRIISELDRSDYPVKILVVDQPWPGDAADVVPKTDHMANYPEQRARIDAALLRNNCFIWQFDYHGLVWRENYTAGGCAILGSAGSTNDSGNIRALDEPNYDEYYANESDMADGVVIHVWGKVTLTDVDDLMTITAVGRGGQDTDALIDRVGGFVSWNVPFTAPADPRPGIDIDDFHLVDEFGRWFVEMATEIPGIPAKAAGMVPLPRTDYAQAGDVRVENATQLISLAITDLDTEGNGLGLTGIMANIDAVKARLGNPRAVTIYDLPDITLAPTRAAPGRILSSVDFRILDPERPRNAMATWAMTRTGPSVALLEQTWTRNFPDDIDQVPITIFDGSTAPVTNYWVKVTGGFTSFRMGNLVPDQVEKWFRWSSTVADGPVANTEAILVDIAHWKAYLLTGGDVTSWDPADGTERTGTRISSNTASGSLLPLYQAMKDSDPMVRRVQVRLKIATPTGTPTISVRGASGSFY